MEIAQLIFLSLIISILGGVCFTWIYLLLFMIKSITISPRLEFIENIEKKFPKISIILPARNEEKFIRHCIDSLLKQDYPDFEIILVNDESTDKTLEIMKEFEKSHPAKIKVVNVTHRDENWIGKNWACYQGYLKSNGNLLLFTDADSCHSEKTLSLAVQNIIHNRLDAITVMPMLLCYDFLTKVTIPILTTFMHTRFSPLKVNNAKSRVGYFIGSYFIINRDTYEKVGTHESVKHEIIEDGALGKKVKEANFKMKMVRGETYIQAIWARNSPELFNAIDRLVIPLFKEKRLEASLLSIALFFLLLFPALIFPLSLISSINNQNLINYGISLLSGLILVILLITNIIQIQKTLFFNKIYSIGFMIGGAIIVSRFINRLIKYNTKSIINWRDRIYTLSTDQTSPL
ncbi:MAG TPA: glycosyltransferase [Nitrososphaeraceae archaeon]|jgi:glycosyltransferase involved in cell wall biosynthesis|nr:glycosyltransferase [Nitrososphaeraceae archaeon]